MSDEITLYNDVKSLSTDLSKSNLIPQALKRKPEDIVAIVLTGREMNLGPMQSLRAFHIINGVVTMKAETMAALVRSSPVCEYLLLKESTAKIATFETKRKGDQTPTTLSFTIDEAKQAGLTVNQTWSKYPAALLRARAVSALCKAVYSDLLLGVYEESEIERVVAGPAEDLKARIKAEVTVVDAEIVPVELVAPADPVAPSEPPSLADQIAAAATHEDLRKLLEPIKASPAAELEVLKELYRARVKELQS